MIHSALMTQFNNQVNFTSARILCEVRGLFQYCIRGEEEHRAPVLFMCTDSVYIEQSTDGTFLWHALSTCANGFVCKCIDWLSGLLPLVFIGSYSQMCFLP